LESLIGDDALLVLVFGAECEGIGCRYHRFGPKGSDRTTQTCLCTLYSLLLLGRSTRLLLTLIILLIGLTILRQTLLVLPSFSFRQTLLLFLRSHMLLDQQGFQIVHLRKLFLIHCSIIFINIYGFVSVLLRSGGKFRLRVIFSLNRL